MNYESVLRIYSMALSNVVALLNYQCRGQS